MHRNPYVTALGWIALGVFAFGVLVYVLVVIQHDGPYGPDHTPYLAWVGMGLGVVWLVAKAITWQISAKDRGVTPAKR